ncbi:MAG TPA: ankyrin repeat domain-containing protein [Candidatus Acidoferrales bacterium]|nr:ankyrin repeat domain-containing protein [Candidatus Acidoferrales bacterium]
MIDSWLNAKRIPSVEAIGVACSLIVMAGFLGCMSGHKSGQWFDRSYRVSFECNEGFKSVRIIDNETGKPETDPALRRVALNQSESAIRDILNQAGLKRAEGQFDLSLQGSSEPYLVSWSGADIPELDQLMHAAATWDLDTVRRIISGGMNVDARALDSTNTALILAASDPTKLVTPARLSRFKHPPDRGTFEYLLAAGANPNAKGYLGATALMRANDAFIAQALIHHGADVNAKDNDGWGALVYAIRDGNMEKIQALVNAHADVNARDNKGWTPLMYAASEGNLEATRLLVASSADPRVANNEGETALKIARAKRKPTPNDREIIELLSAHFPSAVGSYN